MGSVVPVLRVLVFAAFVLAVLVAVAGWLVRTRRLSPFGPLGRMLRALSDPVLAPVEARMLRWGGTPTQAGWWLVIAVAVAGLLLIGLARWLETTVYTLAAAAHAGPGALVALLISAVYDVLVLALIVRVLGSWFGAFRFSRWTRWAYPLTDWLVEPLRRVLPPLGMIDWSPLAAWLILWLLKSFVFTVLW